MNKKRTPIECENGLEWPLNETQTKSQASAQIAASQSVDAILQINVHIRFLAANFVVFTTFFHFDLSLYRMLFLFWQKF